MSINININNESTEQENLPVTITTISAEPTRGNAVSTTADTEEIKLDGDLLQFVSRIGDQHPRELDALKAQLAKLDSISAQVQVQANALRIWLAKEIWHAVNHEHLHRGKKEAKKSNFCLEAQEAAGAKHGLTARSVRTDVRTWHLYTSDLRQLPPDRRPPIRLLNRPWVQVANALELWLDGEDVDNLSDDEKPKKGKTNGKNGKKNDQPKVVTSESVWGDFESLDDEGKAYVAGRILDPAVTELDPDKLVQGEPSADPQRLDVTTG